MKTLWRSLREVRVLLGLDMLESEYITLARLYLAQDFPEKALQILVQLQAIDEELKGVGAGWSRCYACRQSPTRQWEKWIPPLSVLGRALSLPNRKDTCAPLLMMGLR
jgi:hypothetical protein